MGKIDDTKKKLESYRDGLEKIIAEKEDGPYSEHEWQVLDYASATKEIAKAAGVSRISITIEGERPLSFPSAYNELTVTEDALQSVKASVAGDHVKAQKLHKEALQKLEKMTEATFPYAGAGLTPCSTSAKDNFNAWTRLAKESHNKLLSPVDHVKCVKRVAQLTAGMVDAALYELNKNPDKFLQASGETRGTPSTYLRDMHIKAPTTAKEKGANK